MILNKLTLNNFRQFRGSHEIGFAFSKDKNVTLIIGLNTFGKSTILNAIHFALFGDVQSDFDDPTHLLNFGAERNNDPHLKVALEFEFEGSRYIIEREKKYHYHAGGQTKSTDTVRAFQIDERSGNWAPVPHHQTLINRAIPKEMAPHFIFHGEKRVDSFKTSATKRQVGDAIRKILGCNLIETALDDLARLSKKLGTAAGMDVGEQVLKGMQENLDSLYKQVELRSERIQQLEDQNDLAEAKVEQLDAILRDHQQTQKLQHTLDNLRTQLGRKQEDSQIAFRRMCNWFATGAISAVSDAAAESALSAIDEEEFKGTIPPDYQESFIRELLEREMCICGRELKKGSEAQAAVTALIVKGGRKDVLDAALKTKAAAERYQRQAADSRTNYILYEKQFRQIKQEISSLEAQIQEHEERLRGIDIVELRQHAESREKLKAGNRQRDQEIGKLKREITDINQHIREQKGKFERALRGKPEYEKRKKALGVVDHLIEFLDNQLRLYEEEARKMILDLTNSNLAHMHRAKEAYFDDKFNLRLRDKDTHIEAGKSTGEAQLLVLAFTTALIQFCSQREGRKDLLLTPGTVAPLILDAPFGQLDSVFQGAAISWIPRMAKQVILLVSDTQGQILLRDENTLSRVGACYVIQIPKSGNGQDVATPTYKIGAHDYPTRSEPSGNSTTLERIW